MKYVQGVDKIVDGESEVEWMWREAKRTYPMQKTKKERKCCPLLSERKCGVDPICNGNHLLNVLVLGMIANQLI